jgi:hypothetical protein
MRKKRELDWQLNVMQNPHPLNAGKGDRTLRFSTKPQALKARDAVVAAGIEARLTTLTTIKKRAKWPHSDDYI